MTRKEYETHAHTPPDSYKGIPFAGCQAMVQGYPDLHCKGCLDILRDRKAKRLKGGKP